MGLTNKDINKIKLYFSGNNIDEDENYITEIFCDINKEHELKSVLIKQFHEIPEDEGMNENRLNEILYKLHYEINTNLAEKKERKFQRFLKWSLRLAGIIILPLSIFWGIKGYLNYSTEKEIWVEINAPAWTRAQFSLPDGTKGYLNSNSSIKYYGTFNTNRQITLKGEAFFDVFKDKNRPFIVDANEVIVKVLGTKFNIASYENETNVEVVVEEGEVSINNRTSNKSIIMEPNDLVVYNKKLDDFTTEVIQPQKYTSWTEGKLIFRNDAIDAIARKLERWYNIDVEIKGNINQELRLRGTFVDESLDEVLNILRLSLPIDYKIEDRGLKSDETFSKKKVTVVLRK